MSARTLPLLLALIAVVVIVAIAGGLLVNELRRRIQEPYKGYEGHEVFVEIPQGAGSFSGRPPVLVARR